MNITKIPSLNTHNDLHKINVMYKPKEVTIQELWESKLINEPSVRALRERARDGILRFLRADGRVQLYDLYISVIRVVASRRCKRPGVTWIHLKNALNNNENLTLTDGAIEQRLSESQKPEEHIEELTRELEKEIQAFLHTHFGV